MSEKTKKKKGRLIPLLVILILACCVGFGIMQIVQNPDEYQKKSELAEVMGLNTEQENNILEIFSLCGIGEITEVSLFQEGENSSSYWVDDEETAFYNDSIVVWLNNDDKTVAAIYYHDYDIYLDGTVLTQVTNYYVSSAQRDEYRVSAQLAINQLLNYPDTADYPSISGWKFGVSEEGYHIVKSSVTADNALGVSVTEEFQILYENSNIISLILDGTEYIK